MGKQPGLSCSGKLLSLWGHREEVGLLPGALGEELEPQQGGCPGRSQPLNLGGEEGPGSSFVPPSSLLAQLI